MKITNFIDWKSIYEEVKEKHLKEYPKATDYIKDRKYFEEPLDYVKEMYRVLKQDFSELEVNNSDDYDDDYLASLLKDGLVEIEFSEHGNNATENGDDYWGFGFIFTIDLENELFVGYRYENYG